MQSQRLIICMAVLVALALMSQTSVNPPVNDYVGFTAPLSPPVFKSAAKSYKDITLSKPEDKDIKEMIEACGGTASFYRFVLQHNNRNGTANLPKGKVIAQLAGYNSIFIDPCGSRLVPESMYFIETFLATSDTRTAPDRHLNVFCAESEQRAKRAAFNYSLISGFVPTPTQTLNYDVNGVAAIQLPPQNPQDQQKMLQYVSNTLAPNKTLMMTWAYEYDACPPVTLPNCTGSFEQHDLKFQKTCFDPYSNPTAKTPFKPDQYCGN